MSRDVTFQTADHQLSRRTLTVLECVDQAAGLFQTQFLRPIDLTALLQEHRHLDPLLPSESVQRFYLCRRGHARSAGLIHG